MEKRLVLDLSGNGREMRKKAFKFASGFSEVYSVKLIGSEKNKLEVLGEGMDPVNLVTKLKSKLGGCKFNLLKDYGPFNVKVESFGPLEKGEKK